jgi:hypothetical protein
MDPFAQLVQNIIKEQETIIGPVAMEQASHVSGLKIDPQGNQITLTGDKKNVLENLVKQYESLFGRTSIEVCKEAIHGSKTQISPDDLPDILK